MVDTVNHRATIHPVDVEIFWTTHDWGNLRDTLLHNADVR